MTLPERIRAYVAAMPPALSDQGGHRATFVVACALVHGFDLSIAEALPYLEEYNLRCQPAWNHRELMHKLTSAEKASPNADKPRGHLLNGKPKGDASAPAGPAPAPKKEQKREEWAKVNREAIASFTAGLPSIDSEYFRKRSPIDLSSVTSGDFLDSIFEPGDRVMIFTRYYSQGDFVWWVRHDAKGIAARGTGWRLSDQLETRAIPSLLPTTGRLGAWFLVQPVTGKWEIGDRAKNGEVKYTRRSEQNVSRWLHFMLESDIEGSEEWWPKVVAALRLPIVAIYSSGGRSLHALIRYPVPSKAHWDNLRDNLLKNVCPLGADPGVNSAVRLSRLPGVMREGKEEEFTKPDGKAGKKYVRYPKPQLQRLVYLNPAAGYEPIIALPEIRE